MKTTKKCRVNKWRKPDHWLLWDKIYIKTFFLSNPLQNPNLNFPNTPWSEEPDLFSIYQKRAKMMNCPSKTCLNHLWTDKYKFISNTKNSSTILNKPLWSHPQVQSRLIPKVDSLSKVLNPSIKGLNWLIRSTITIISKRKIRSFWRVQKRRKSRPFTKPLPTTAKSLTFLIGNLKSKSTKANEPSSSTKNKSKHNSPIPSATLVPEEKILIQPFNNC